MSGFLADTNIPSELTRPNPDPRLVAFLKDAGKEPIYLSALTLGEIRKGVAILPDGNKRKQLEAWIETTMRPWFAGRILPVSEEIAERWGLLAADARQRGVGLSVIDGLIAATALVHELTLLTRNVKDFEGTGVSIRNPWES